MFDGKTVAFRLPGGTPALSVSTINCEKFAAVDGRECVVYVYSSCGRFLETRPTARAYGVLTAMGENGYLALAHCSCRRFANRVYFLNRDFEEVGSFDLESCFEELGELSDVFYTEDGEIYAAIKHTLKIFNGTGSNTAEFTNPGCGRIYNVATNGNMTAIHHRGYWGDVLTVSSDRDSYASAVCGQTVLRDLLPTETDAFYGLFGFRYQYNYLMPIYAEGRIILPEQNDLLRFLQNITPCS